MSPDKEEKAEEKANEETKFIKEKIARPEIVAILELGKQQALWAKEMQRFVDGAQLREFAQMQESIRLASQELAETVMRAQVAATSFIIPHELIENLNHAKKEFEESRFALESIASPDLITREQLQEDNISGLKTTIRAQSSHIQLLERIIAQKDEQIQQLEQRLDDKKKKKPDQSIV